MAYNEMHGNPISAPVSKYEMYKFLDLYLMFDNTQLDKVTRKFIKKAEDAREIKRQKKI